MASTITLQRTLNYARTMAQLRPLDNLGGFTLEPALTDGDWVKQFILSPPFAWRWNRSTTTQAITNANQDYTIALSTFGWLEKAVITTGSTFSKELEIKLDLAEDGTLGEPSFISTQSDNGSGNITFRLSPKPDIDYSLLLTWQRSAALFTAFSETWTPIPDYLSYVYTQGFLSKVYEMSNDARFPIALQLFLRQLIAANDGLTDSQKNLFMESRIITQSNIQAALGATRSAQGLYGGGQ